MTVKEKIQEYLEYKGISPTAAERELKWGVGAFTKAKSITVDRAKEFLLLFTDLSAEWLLRGTGNMILQSGDSNSNNDEELRKEIFRLETENKLLRELVGLKTNEVSKEKSA